MVSNDRCAEQICRLLCQRECQSPDDMVLDIKTAERGPFGSLRVNKSVRMVRAWEMYLPLVTPIIEALDRRK